MPALFIAAVIAVIAATSGSAVYASQGALPGDALYEVKRTAEGLELALAPDEAARAQLHLDLAARRLAEIKRASGYGRTEAATVAAEALAGQVALADEQLARAAAKGKDVSAVASFLAEKLSQQEQILDEVSRRVPDQARPALEKARQATKRGLKEATSHYGAQWAPGAGEGAKPKPPAGKTEELTPTPTSTTTATPTGTVGSTATPTATVNVEIVPISTAVSTEIAGAIADTRELADDPNVPGQSYDGLLAKLNAAQAALDRGQPKVALNVLGAFLGHLNAMRRSGHISDENYEAVYARYEAIVTALGGTPEPQTTPHPQADRDTEATPQPTEQADEDKPSATHANRAGNGHLMGVAEPTPYPTQATDARSGNEPRSRSSREAAPRDPSGRSDAQPQRPSSGNGSSHSNGANGSEANGNGSRSNSRR